MNPAHRIRFPRSSRGGRGPRPGRARLAAALATLVLAFAPWIAPAASAQPLLFHSPADDGLPSASAEAFPSGASGSLFLYLSTGPTASSAADEVCVGGDGDELCAAQIELRAEGSFSITGFVPDAGGDVVFAGTESDLRLNLLDPISPTPGTRRLGEVTLATDPTTDCAAATCRVTVERFETVAADLALVTGSLATPDTTLAVPEPLLPAALGLGVAGLATLVRRRTGRSERKAARRRGSVRFATLTGLALMSGLPAKAQIATLPDARYITRCLADEQDLPVANTSFCDRPQAFAWTGSLGQSTASAEAVVSAEAFSSRPRIPKGVPEELALRLQPLLSEPFAAIAFVQAAASYTPSGPFQPPPPGADVSQIDGTAAIEATFVVRQTATPPIAVPAVPLVLRVLGEMTVLGAGNNEGSFRVTVNGDPEDSFEFISPAAGFYSVDSEFPGELFTIEEGQTFIKQVTCSAEARWPGGNGFCSAVLDPIIELDQASADAILGASSFPLADYFAIEYSENILVEAPANVCGDVSLDELVLESDLDLLRQSLIGEVTLSSAALDRCATRDESTGCDLADAVVLARTVGSGSAPRPPGIAAACAAVAGP